MPKFADAKVGDTVILKGIVIRAATTRSFGRIEFESGLHSIDTYHEVEQIIPPPWEPQVGDQVTHIERENMYSHSSHDVTLLHIHQDYSNSDRKWATVAFKGDIPKSVYYKDLRPCAV